jgi:GNAT superfamily N-acetyltransferase
MQIVRPAGARDAAAIVELAHAYGLVGVDSVENPQYRTLLTRFGRLLVAERAGAVVGFGGMIDTAQAAMVTDLFVAEDQQGHGVGRALLAALLHDRPRRMTCSSSHPAAQRLYASFGMQPHWQLRYLRLTVPTRTPGELDAELRWGHADAAHSDRPELGLLADDLRWVGLQRDGEPVGHALLAAPAATTPWWQVFRLRTSLPHDVAMRAVLVAVGSGTAVECCLPAWSAAVPLLESLGAIDVDADTFMSSLPAGSDGIDRDLAVINPGLA